MKSITTTTGHSHRCWFEDSFRRCWLGNSFRKYRWECYLHECRWGHFCRY